MLLAGRDEFCGAGHSYRANDHNWYGEYDPEKYSGYALEKSPAGQRKPTFVETSSGVSTGG